MRPFNAAAGTSTYDASFMDVEFIPEGGHADAAVCLCLGGIPRILNSLYQDFIGVWVNGQQVDLAVGDGDIDPLNINGGNNESLFISTSMMNTHRDGWLHRHHDAEDERQRW